MTDATTITVNLMGTFSEKQRPNNGLERIARYLIENRLSHVPIVAEIGFHKYSETLTGHVLTVKLLAVESGFDAKGEDPDGTGADIRALLDKVRKSEGKGAVEETLFSMPVDGFDFDGPGDEPAGELEGQTEIRIGPDGEHAVPPPSGEEVVAELDERRAAKASRKPTADPFDASNTEGATP